MNTRFNFDRTPSPMEKLTSSLLEKARKNAGPMTGMDADQQADYLLGRINRSDIFFVVYPRADACLDFEITIIKGEADAAAIGFVLGASDGTSPVSIPRVKPRRGLSTDALLVPGKREAEVVVMAYSALPQAVAWRQAQIDDGGPQTLRNVRLYATPYGFTNHPMDGEA
ncbi:hypothetical protein MKK64_23775 [Methylobacterium sp. E-025]|uniref:hypothetical protein n=1 Tax=Methylobacterium sp. E-025 TaxID=2836561 RepID=UPI001FBB3CA3|nr:hypothetical protein [Methylobacterium sp. E-025]MCJ2114192.1 hypothetical protein [Methylobacterium sp. E-025]